MKRKGVRGKEWKEMSRGWKRCGKQGLKLGEERRGEEKARIKERCRREEGGRGERRGRGAARGGGEEGWG